MRTWTGRVDARALEQVATELPKTVSQRQGRYRARRMPLLVTPTTSVTWQAVGDLDGVLAQFDTIVLMKIGTEMPRIVDAVRRAGLLDRAVYVSKATMAEQRIVRDLREIESERGDCFAMVIVSRKERSGVLAGTVPLREVAS